MLLMFTVPATGRAHSVELKPVLVQEYRETVSDMIKYHSPSLDRLRRAAHNKLAEPVLAVLQSELPTEDPAELSKEARHIVATFLEQSLTGRSTVRELLASNTLL